MQIALERVFSEATGISFTWDESLRRIPRAPIGVLSLGDSRTVGRDAHRYTFRDSDISLDMYGSRRGLTVSDSLDICNFFLFVYKERFRVQQ